MIPDHNQRRMMYLGLIQKTTGQDTYSASYVGKRIGVVSMITWMPITPWVNPERVVSCWRSIPMAVGLMCVSPRI